MGTENARKWAACLLVFGWVLISGGPVHAAMLEAHTWQRWEHGLKSTREYGNPYADLTLRVTYVGPGGRTLRTYGFWDGGDTFRIRCAFPVSGVWQWETECSDATNAGLHHQRGTVKVSPYRGDSPLYQRGFLKVSDNRRHLIFGDGTPFLWNGDTAWAVPQKASLEEWESYLADRTTKHFTVVQVGPASEWAGERDRQGQKPFADKSCSQWNPAYWQAFERKVQRANESGLVVLMVGLMEPVSRYPESGKACLFARNIIARLFGNFVIFSPSFDSAFMPLANEVGRAARDATDAHLITQHPGTPWNQPTPTFSLQYYDEPYLDIAAVQTGHNAGHLDWCARNAIDWNLRLYRHEPHKPVINLEAMYDAQGTNGWRAFDARSLGWRTWLSGAMGYTYGAGDLPPKVPQGSGALWKWVTDPEKYDYWKKALQWESAFQMQYLHDFLSTMEWWRLEPAHELILDQSSEVTRRMMLAKTAKGDLAVAYLPDNAAIEVDMSGFPLPLTARWFDPVHGLYIAIDGPVANAGRHRFTPPGQQDWVLLLQTNQVRQKSEVPLRPSRGKQLDAMMARFDLFDVFPSAPVPGYPGADPSKGRPPWERYPEFQNYPGSVEHFRVDEQKYIPPLNPFNMRSLICNFQAAELPGVDAQLTELYGEPIVYVQRNAPTVVTGEKRPPVTVVRLKPGGQRLKLKIGPLPWGLYVVRLIACLEEKNVRSGLPEDLVLEMKINDGPKGEVNTYALRQRGTYNFYSMGEFFFRVESATPRTFEIDLGSHPESKVDLLVHNVDVHDRLYACAKRAGKTESAAIRPEVLQAQWETPEGRQIQKSAKERRDAELAAFSRKSPGLSGDELGKKWRQERDDILWQQLPPLNAAINTQGSGHYAVASEMDPATEEQLKAQGMVFNKEWSAWEGLKPPVGFATWHFDYDPYGFNPIRLVFLDGKQPGKNPVHTYTWEDLKLLKPLPGLPFPVHPWGRRFADDQGCYFFFPQVAAIYAALSTQDYRLKDGRFLEAYLKGGDLTAARDMALQLIHMAYEAPTYSVLHKMNVVLGDQKRNMGRRYAHEDRGIHYNVFEWSALAATYDQLFPVIQGNQELADAAGRYIPWVKQPEDVVRLLDTFLLQFGAQEAMCFQKYYSHEHAGMLASLASVQGNAPISDPWMESLFNWTWEYPGRVGPFLGFMYKSLQRDGSTDIGSFFYAQSGGLAAKVQEAIDNSNGRISSKFTLKDIPRVAATPWWFMEARTAGLHHPGIGDVGGPCITHGEWMQGIGHWMRMGWQWTKSPRFARGVTLFGGRKLETDAEWAELAKAAEGVRHPYMANRSRALANWGGFLEGGTQSDDFRFRHAARVRIGTGTGHAHADTLDLGLWSLGLCLAPDGGARGGYGRPDVQKSWMHNVVTLDKADRSSHAWCTDLADMDGCQYLSARASSSPIFARQVAMIEVDQGGPTTRPPSDPSLKPGTTYDNDIVLPKAYFVDFFRAKGGNRDHAYNFHGLTDDEFAVNVKPRALDEFETNWLDSQTPGKKSYILPGEQWGGTVDAEVLTATWRVAREPRKFVADDRGERTTRAPEPAIMGAAYDPNSPRKYLRLHLPGQKGASFLTGAWVSAASGEGRTDGEYLRQTHLVRKTHESLFAAVFEPYAGTPFIESVSAEGDPTKSDSHAALHVKLLAGQQDLCFGDLAGAPSRTLKDGTQVQARFAYLSRDKNGLRQVNLVGGRHLAIKELSIVPQSDEWSAKVAQVDYDQQTLLLDGIWPAKVLNGAFFEVGSPAEGSYPERWTNFEAVKVEPKDGKTQLQWRKGADIGLAEVEGFARNDKRPGAWNVQFDAILDLQAGPSRFYAVNEKKDKQWKCDSNGGTCVLYGRETKADDLKPGDRILFYEFGVGATFRAPTKVSLKRVAPGIHALTASVPCEIQFTAAGAETSADGKQWQPAANPLKVQPDQIPNGGLKLRWK